MAKKNNIAPKEDVQVSEVIIESLDFNDFENVTVIGCGTHGMKEEKEFNIIGKLAKVLIKKGAAKLK
jgi:hypothetical protein